MKYNTTRIRGIALLLLATLLLGLCPSVFADDTAIVTHVKTVEDLNKLADNCRLDSWSQGRTVSLDADIALDGADFSGIPSFGGTFQGNGHTISGLSLTGKDSFSGLFRTIQESGTVENLNVSGDIAITGNEAVGGIAAVNYGTITGCSFSGSISGDVCVGGIVGTNELLGSILNCSSAGSVTGDKMTGGIVGNHQGLAVGCTNTAYVNTTQTDKTISASDISIDTTFDLSKLTTTETPSASTDMGGIAGYCAGVIRECENTAVIGYPHVGYNVGGIAGRSCGYIVSCQNSGSIYGRKDIGGIAGQMAPYIEMTLSKDMLSDLQQQLADLNALIDKAADDAESGANGISDQMNTMSGYVQSASSAANNISVVIDAGGSVTGSGDNAQDTDITVTPPDVTVSGDAGSSGSLDIDLSPGSISIDNIKDAAGSISSDTTPGDIGIDSSGSAGGQLSGSAQVVAAPNLGGLTSAINGIGSQLSRINSALTSTTGVLTDDVRAINEQFNTLSNSMFDAIFAVQDGDVITDTSELDVDLVTLGKIADSQNNGTLSGDLNVGGITGSMSNEYELDPEDDVTSDLSPEYQREYEMKAVIQGCTNHGAVTAKRDYSGGICGRMDLGLITESYGFCDVTSESGSYVGGIAGLTSATIWSSLSKGTLSGKSYVGGIVGSGVTQDLTGASSTVTGCCSLVKIQDTPEYMGAVSGANNGSFLWNYFVSDELSGIDGQSYAGKAEPTTYQKMIATDGIPEEMKTLHLQFVADDTVLAQEDFDYGDSFPTDIYPEIPEKEGYSAQWDITELTNLHFDTVVTAVYTPYTTAIPTDTKTQNGTPVFLAEGDFDGEPVVDAQMSQKDTAAFCPLTAGLFDAVRHYLRSAPWYRLPITPIAQDVVEQWSITIPSDGQSEHSIHYLAPNDNPEQMRIYLRQDDSWTEADTSVYGSYLVFPVSGTTAEIAAVSELSLWWAWAILAGLLAAVLLLLVLLFRKIVKRHRKKKAPTAQMQDAAASVSPAKPKKRKKWWWILLLVLLLIGVLASGILLLLHHSEAPAYRALAELNQQDECSMHITVQATLGDLDTSTELILQRKEENGHTFTNLALGDISLYYTDGMLILEDGKAYTLGSSSPDYAALLEHLLPLYNHLEITSDGDTYRVTATGETAQEIITLLLPQTAGALADTQQLTAQLTLRENTVTNITLSADGVLTDDSQTAFSLSVSMDQITDQASFTIPQAVLDAADTAAPAELPTMNQDLMNLMTAWYQWNQQDTHLAEVSLTANCGPVVVNDQLELSSALLDGTTVYGIRKNGLSIYWSDGQLLNQDGTPVSDQQQTPENMAQLLDVAYLICQDGVFTTSQQADGTIYTMGLDGDSMEEIAALIAPDAAALGPELTGGTLTVHVTDGALTGISVELGGNVTVATFSTSVSITGQIAFKDGTVTIPEAVQDALH